MEELESLLNQCRDAFSNESTWQKARELAYGTLTCMGRHTITGMLTASGQQFMDWTSAYRIFSQQRVTISKLFKVACISTVEELPPSLDITVSIDDTLLKKTGKRIPGTSWKRDPLGPAFYTNFIWGQRYLQISMALPEHEGVARSRAIPIDFHHCPSIKKPGKTADEAAKKNYNEAKKKQKLSVKGRERLGCLRESLDQQGFQSRQIIACVDGSYTNKEMLKKLPERTILIGRIRKDTKLYALPEKQGDLGRKRVYGNRLPTPEEIRQSDEYSWEQVKAWAAGKEHNFSVKVIKSVRWRSAGEKHDLQLLVIRPLSYRLTKSSKLLYREPAYLICTDNSMSKEKLLQSYLWRWEIEVNFREEKTNLGCGQAQIRNPQSVESVPGFIVAMYSFLLLAAFRSYKESDELLPRPLWYIKKKEKRVTTGDIINNLRAHLWCNAIDMNFSGFVDQEIYIRSLKINNKPWSSAMFYMRN